MSRQGILWAVLAAVGVVFVVSRTQAGANLISAAVGKAVSLVKRWEGLRLDAYQDVAGFWTIGYGHLIRPGERFHPYGPVKRITEAEAAALLQADMASARNAVAQYVRVPLTAGQRAALESLAFNIGSGAFASSTLVRKLNAGDYAGAAEEFARWNKAGGAVVQGLANRRADERAVFLS
jgi:lysozyme